MKITIFLSMFDKKIKVLIVDDSLVFRSYLANSLKKDPEIEVVGTAMNGKAALSSIPILKPDICTLDIEMPVMNGVETLREIRKLYPSLQVIMVSSQTSEGADITLQCLESGANDFILKEAADASPDSSSNLKLSQILIQKIKKVHRNTPFLKIKEDPPEIPGFGKSSLQDPIGNLIIPGTRPLFLFLCCEESFLGHLLLLVRNLSSAVTIPILFKIMVPDVFLSSLIKAFERNNRNYSYKVASSSCFLEPRNLYLFGERHQFGRFQNMPVLKTEVVMAHEKVSLNSTFQDIESFKLPNTPIFLLGDDPSGDGIKGLKSLTQNGFPTVYVTKCPGFFIDQKNILAHEILDISNFGSAINKFLDSQLFQ